MGEVVTIDVMVKVEFVVYVTMNQQVTRGR